MDKKRAAEKFIQQLNHKIMDQLRGSLSDEQWIEFWESCIARLETTLSEAEKRGEKRERERCMEIIEYNGGDNEWVLGKIRSGYILY